MHRTGPSVLISLCLGRILTGAVPGSGFRWANTDCPRGPAVAAAHGGLGLNFNAEFGLVKEVAKPKERNSTLRNS